MKKHIYILLVGLFFLPSCFEDKGNYDYETINEISIGDIDNTYSLLIDDEEQNTLTLDPSITLGLEDSNNLRYEWFLKGYDDDDEPGDLYSKEKLLVFTPEAVGTYYFKLIVTDTVTTIAQYKEFSVKVKNIFSNGLIVLGKNMDGSGDFKFISDAVGVVDKTFEEISGVPMCDDPYTILNMEGSKVFQIISHDAGKGLALNFGSMELDYYIDETKFSPFPTEKISYIGHPSIGNVGLVSGGKLYSANSFFIMYNAGSQFYGVGLDETYNIVDYYETHDYSWAPLFLSYDNITKRFINIKNKFGFSGRDYAYLFDGIDEVSHIDGDGNKQNSTIVGKTYIKGGKVKDKYIAIFKDAGGYEIKIFSYESGSIIFLRSIIIGDEFIDENSLYTFSETSSNFYFSNKNKVYKFNILAGTSPELLNTYSEDENITMLNYIYAIAYMDTEDGNEFVRKASLYVGSTKASGLGSIFETDEYGSSLNTWEDVINNPVSISVKK